MNNNRATVLFDAIGERVCLPHTLAFLLFPASLFLVLKFASAEPYLPHDETRVLDHLPTNLVALFSNDNKFESRVKRHTVSPEQWEVLQQNRVTSYLNHAKASGDMRYLSYAENRLQNWLQETPQSEKARLLDAQIKQYNHNFKAAIQHLESLTMDHPKNIEAWSLLANLQLLTGDYHAAKSSCKQLSARSNLTDSIICQSNIMIRTGELHKAHKMLRALLVGANTMPVQRQVWLYTSMAEIKLQRNKITQAGYYIEKAVKLVADNGLNDNYLSRLHIDYLIQKNNLKQAFELVRNKKNDSAMMIRSAVIAKKLGYETNFDMSRIALSQTFEIERRRGLGRHLREQALFTLLVLNRPAEAFEIAQENWVTQKEPEDARILLKSALSVGDEALFQQVQAEIKNTGLIDLRLDIDYLRGSVI